MVKKKILLPRDEELRELLEKSFLHRETYQFIMAADGAEAIQMIEEQDPVLAILDLDMEGLSGDECCREVKSDPFLSDTPLALIATSSNPAALERCESSGCDAVLTKPVEKSVLLATICRLLDIVLRGEARVSIDLPAQLRCGDERAHDAQGVDLNHAGMFLRTMWLHPAGSRLQLNIFVPGRSEPLPCEIEVVWVNHHEWIKAHRLPVGMGVKFVAPSADFAQAIDEIYTSATGA